jgi:hypothetical protein
MYEAAFRNIDDTLWKDAGGRRVHGAFWRRQILAL